MRANRLALVLGALCVVSLAAQPARAQDAARRAERRDAGAREGWHEARRREAAERRAALLEWHRARRLGSEPESAARGAFAPERAAATARPASFERGPALTVEPMVVEAGSGLRVLGPAVEPGFERAARSFGHERRGFDRGRRGFEHDRRGFRGFDHDVRGWRGDPYGRFGSPFGFEDLVCVARIGDPYGAGVWPYDPYRRAGLLELRATCLPSFRSGYGGYGWGAPYGWIGDPTRYGFPYGGVPLPVPHRFSHRFFPRTQDLPWAAESGWLPGGEDGYGYEFEELFR